MNLWVDSLGSVSLQCNGMLFHLPTGNPFKHPFAPCKKHTASFTEALLAKEHEGKSYRLLAT